VVLRKVPTRDVSSAPLAPVDATVADEPRFSQCNGTVSGIAQATRRNQSLCMPGSEFGTFSFRKLEGMADETDELVEILESSGVTEKD
jgi:hypothetical protein